MRIITGGAGFIGSAICWKLNTLGHRDIILVDTDAAGTKNDNIQGLAFSDFINRDTFLKNISSSSMSGDFDTVYHMGASTSTTEQDMDLLLENNVEFSKRVAEWSLKNNARFIYASSAATYGSGELGFDDNLKLLDKLNPLNKYGLSKQLFDLWVMNTGLADKVVGLKYFNIFGPNEDHKGDMRSMVNKAFQQINGEGKIRLFRSYRAEYADGEQLRDFLYVKDAVNMTVHFDLNGTGRLHCGIFNIGSGSASSWNRLAKAVFKALGKEPVIEYIDMPDNIKDQYQYYSKAEIQKLRNAGFRKDVIKLEDAVNDYVVNYLVPGKHLS